MYCLLFLEFIGTTELFVVLLFALIIFGLRKLPELSRSLARALNQMRTASNDLKHTWEAEAQTECETRAPLTLPAAEQCDAKVFQAQPEHSGKESTSTSMEAEAVGHAFECEPAMPSNAAGTTFKAQPLELHG